MTECLFFTPAGVPLFTRADMEEGHWVQQEMNVTATFPFDMDKVIVRGMRIGFTDTATGTFELFEIRNVQNTEPDHYQQITAEHIAVAELSDEHIDSAEITDQTASAALATALTGTLWSVGNVAVNPTSSGDISRGSVWQAVCMIIQNWNVYIVPRVTLSAGGAVSGRYLDIQQAGGTFRGLRLSIDMNMSDAAVTYDDTEVYTALYGYGAGVETTPGADKVPLTFSEIAWTATSEHPAKPSGQRYLEDPTKTALYGRNGRPRFGFYQNADISDAETLLEKTWEALKATSDPKISISGTVTDLYRLGYDDVPIRLHDIAIIEIRGTGESFQKEIIQLDVDLVDPTATQPVIGDYIPSIVYIVRDNNEKAGGGGGGGGRGNTNTEYERKEFHTDILANDYKISLSATQEDMNTVDEILRQAGLEIDATTGVLIYHYDNANMLQSKMNVQAGQIGLVVEGTGENAQIKAAEIVAAINGQTGESIVRLSADFIDIDGLVSSFTSMGITVQDFTCTGEAIFDSITTDAITSVYSELGDIVGDSAEIDGEVSCGSLSVNGDAAEWQATTMVSDVSYTANNVTVQLASGTGFAMDYIKEMSVTKSVLHYLGSAATAPT